MTLQDWLNDPTAPEFSNNWPDVLAMLQTLSVEDAALVADHIKHLTDQTCSLQSRIDDARRILEQPA